MTAVLGPATCYLIRSGTRDDPNRRHLFVCLTPQTRCGRFVFVSISKVSPHYFCDEACRLAPGEHEFIKIESFARYQKATALSQAALDQMIADSQAERLEPDASGELCDKLRAGLLASAFTPLWLRNLYCETMKVDAERCAGARTT